jgi:hypothetical protein
MASLKYKFNKYGLYNAMFVTTTLLMFNIGYFILPLNYFPYSNGRDKISAWADKYQRTIK